MEFSQRKLNKKVLRFDELEIEINGASSADLELTANSLSINNSGASTIKLAGKSEESVFRPFREKCFDAIVLMNVLEHVFATDVFLAELTKLLKPGGKLLVAIPFLLKVHQAPFDFVRYTQFSLEKFGEQNGLDVDRLEGYYDPMFLLEQGSNNLKHSVFPGLPKLKNYFARILMAISSLFNAGLVTLVGGGFTNEPQKEQSPAPIGYHVVYQKGSS